MRKFFYAWHFVFSFLWKMISCSTKQNFQSRDTVKLILKKAQRKRRTQVGVVLIEDLKP